MTVTELIRNCLQFHVDGKEAVVIIRKRDENGMVTEKRRVPVTSVHSHHDNEVRICIEESDLERMS